MALAYPEELDSGGGGNPLKDLMMKLKAKKQFVNMGKSKFSILERAARANEESMLGSSLH